MEREQLRKKQIRIPPHVMAGIQMRMALIQQKELEITVLRDGLTQFIQSQTGADLNQEEWSLDLDHALLERVATRARKQP